MQQNRETIQADFVGYINGAYKTSGPIFAVMVARMFLFSEARFQFRRLTNGRPGKLFGNQDLQILEHPWPNATTGDLLGRAINDVDLAGNFYATRVPRLDGQGSKLARLRPDWVTILKGTIDGTKPSLDSWDPSAELIGYIYQPGGPGSGAKPHTYLPHEVMHFAPIPDPAATYRGMSWVQPVITEVLGDRAMTTHMIMYFENGACLRGSARVATPTGWTRMDEIKVGDQVIGSDGRPTRVLGVYRPGVKDIYRVTFTGGVSVDCCEDHLWQVQTYGQRTGGSSGRYLKGYQVRSLRSLMDEGLRYPSGPAKFTIPLTDPVRYDDPGPLPLDPYVLGCLLGDGSMTGHHVSLAAHRDDAGWLHDEMRSLLPAGLGVDVKRRDRGGQASELSFSRRSGVRSNPVLATVRSLGVAVVHNQKFVPELYMRASVEDRISLLQGLCDTDGHVEAGQPGTIRFTNTSERLARQVMELAESLGGVASIKRRVRKGKNAKTQWSVSFSRLPEGIVPVRLPRKAARYRLSGRFIDRTRFLKSVEPVGHEEVYCIKVEAPDGLYLTDDFIVTHNTPNLVVGMDTGRMDAKTFREWIDVFDSEHSGATNAYKTLYLGNGASATVVGSSLKDLDYSAVQGAVELRIASAGGIHPVILAFDKGLEASSLNNFANARRLVADRTLRPLWRNFAGSMETLVVPPPGTQLWYDDRDIPFLKDDESDAAEVLLTKATAMRLLVDAGYEPDSVVQAMEANDLSLLVGSHTGLYSVQLQPPGSGTGGLPSGTKPNGSQNGNDTKQGNSGPAGALNSADLRQLISQNIHNPQALARVLLARQK